MHTQNKLTSEQAGCVLVVVAFVLISAALKLIGGFAAARLAEQEKTDHEQQRQIEARERLEQAREIVRRFNDKWEGRFIAILTSDPSRPENRDCQILEPHKSDPTVHTTCHASIGMLPHFNGSMGNSWTVHIPMEILGDLQENWFGSAGLDLDQHLRATIPKRFDVRRKGWGN